MNEKAKILIVEDEGIVAADIRNILHRKLGYEVAGIIRSGEEAIESARILTPDLILMDIILGGKLTGIETAAIIKERFNIPVIYLTAFSDKETLAQAKITEPYGYVLKPIDEKVLHSSIEMALYKSNAERLIIENEERYRMLIENSPVAIAVHCEGEIVYVNPAGVKLIGASSDKEILGEPLINFIHRDYQGIVREKIHTLKTKGMSLEGIPEKLIKVDGKIIDVEIAAIPTKYNNKPAIEVVIRDITELKKKERIQKSLLSFLQIAQSGTSLEDCCALFNSALGEYMEVNIFAAAICRKETDDFSYLYLMESEVPHEVTCDLMRFTVKENHSVILGDLQLRKYLSAEHRGKRIAKWIGIPTETSSGNIIVIAAGTSESSALLNQEEKELFNILAEILTNLILKKLNDEDQVNTIKQFEELNLAKDKFFSTLSHQIKNNFNSLLGYTEVLKNEYDTLTRDEINASVDSLYSSSRKVYLLIEKLLRFSKITSSAYQPNLKHVPLRKILEKEISAISVLARKKEIKFNYNQESDYNVFCDEDVISTILQSLLIQTIKFSGNNSKIEVDVSAENDLVEVVVRDKGTGIEEYLLRNLYLSDEPAAKEADKTEHGIGYFLTRESLKKFGGDLEIQNNPGKGSSFNLKIPISKLNIVLS